MESNPKPAEPGTSAGEADRTPRYSHGYSMIPPNLSRRQATLTVASRGMELYEMQKEKNRPSAIHMDPEQLGGSATQSEARVKQFGDSKNSKWQKRLKKMDLDKKNREEEREKNEKMKAEKRKEAERLEEQKKQEEQTLRDRHDVNRQRVMDTFLKKLEDQSRNAV